MKGHWPTENIVQIISFKVNVTDPADYFYVKIGVFIDSGSNELFIPKFSNLVLTLHKGTCMVIIYLIYKVQ